MTTTSTASVGSTTYPALVVEAPTLSEPVWVVFPKTLWENADNQLDATVAFASRARAEPRTAQPNSVPT